VPSAASKFVQPTMPRTTSALSAISSRNIVSVSVGAAWLEAMRLPIETAVQLACLRAVRPRITALTTCAKVCSRRRCIRRSC
jgi:hypothetical protein